VVGDKKALFNGLFDGQSEEVQFERSGSFLSTVKRMIEVPAALAEADDDRASPDENGPEEAADVVDVAPMVAEPKRRFHNSGNGV
jgi:hypothetical protein